MIKSINKLLSNGIEQFVLTTKGEHPLPFYGEFALGLNFRDATDRIKTCGVNVRTNGFFFYYNNKFLDELGTTDGKIRHSDIPEGKRTDIENSLYNDDIVERQRQVNFILIHEIFHLLFNHPQRTVAGGFDKELANIVQDMIINSIIWADINHHSISIPKNPNNKINRLKGIDNKNMALFIPKEYYDSGGTAIFEELYTWMKNKKNAYEDEKKSKGGVKSENNNDSNPPSGNEKSMGDKYADTNGNVIDCGTYSLDEIFDTMEENGGEFMDTHLDDEVPNELRDAMVNDKIDSLKSRGYIPGNIMETINKLRKKRKDHLKEIKRAISNEMLGTNKIPTITRPNRRGIIGIKGRKKVKSEINVILDTSGSMYGLFEKVLEYVFRAEVTINMIQVDTEVKGIIKIKRMKELQNMNIMGLGGTMLQPAIDAINSNPKIQKLNTVILTDGYCDTLDMSLIKGKVLGITTGTKIPIDKKSPKGYREILVEKTK